MSLFFKAPQTADGREPEHDFFLQQGMLDTWLAKS
jgi:hypothetical protein